MMAIEKFARALKLARELPKERRTIMSDAKRRGIRFLPPHVNHSGGIDRIEGNAIRAGLLFVPGIWKPWIATLLMQRRRCGKFRTVRSMFGRRCDIGFLPAESRERRAVLQALRRAGALRGLRP